MNKVKFLRMMFCGLLALLALAPATSASAAQKEILRYSVQGKSARVYGSTYDGCISTGVFVSAIDGRVKMQGRPESYSSAYINFWEYDYCSYTWLDAWGYTELDADALQINNSLNSATLNTTIQVYDYWSGVSLPVNLNLTMEGTGDLSRAKSRSQVSSPIYKSSYRSDSTWREVTVSGTISTPSRTFDIAQYGYSYLESVKSAEMTVYQQ